MPNDTSHDDAFGWRKRWDLSIRMDSNMMYFSFSHDTRLTCAMLEVGMLCRVLVFKVVPPLRSHHEEGCRFSSLWHLTNWMLLVATIFLCASFSIRWCNHLDPSIRKDAWTDEEDRVLVEAQRSYGNKWAEISKLLPGR